MSLAVAPAAVTVARSVLLSNQFPPALRRRKRGTPSPHTHTPSGWLHSVGRDFVCAAIFGLQAGCEASFGQYRSTLHLTPWWGAFAWAESAVWHCAAISGFWAASRARFAQYRSTHLPVRRGLPSNPTCLTSSVLRYLVFRPPPGPVSANIAAQYSWSRISGSSGVRLPAWFTRLGERRKATGGTCASAVTANCARNSHYIMIGCNEN